MNIRTRIHQLVDKLETEDLSIIYEQLKMLESSKQSPPAKACKISLEEIHQATSSSSSKDNWADSVIEDRTDRT
jgi:hypothetical protein